MQSPEDNKTPSERGRIVVCNFISRNIPSMSIYTILTVLCRVRAGFPADEAYFFRARTAAVHPVSVPHPCANLTPFHQLYTIT